MQRDLSIDLVRGGGVLRIALIDCRATVASWVRPQPWRRTPSAAAAKNASLNVPTVHKVMAADTRSVVEPDIPREPA